VFDILSSNFYLAILLIIAAGHVGYELSPFIPTIEGVAALLRCGLKGCRGLNTVQHHDMHHRWAACHQVKSCRFMGNISNVFWCWLHWQHHDMHHRWVQFITHTFSKHVF
jgi:hypothetical protein